MMLVYRWAKRFLGDQTTGNLLILKYLGHKMDFENFFEIDIWEKCMACIQLQYSIGIFKFNEYAFELCMSSFSTHKWTRYKKALSIEYEMCCLYGIDYTFLKS